MTVCNTDLGCENEPLHLMDSIQSFGALVAIDRTQQMVVQCSDNIAEWIGHTPEALLGGNAEQVFGSAWPMLLRLAVESPQRRAAEIDLKSGSCTVTGHCRDHYLILEFEPAARAQPDWWDEAGRIEFLSQLSKTRTPADTVAVLLDTIAEATGYDRVMVYRFLDNWDGEVIDQRCRTDVEGFLGLRFPAQDIPENARRLYKANWQRLIADRDSVDVGLCALENETQRLDMTFSMLRSVHPVHIKYLRNMDVQGSMSVSLIVDGQLWGLVTCHHRRAKRLNAHERLALEEMARIACLHLSSLAKLENESLRSVLRERLSVLNRTLDPAAESPAKVLADHLSMIKQLLDADGVRLRWAGADLRLGDLPSENALNALDCWLSIREPGSRLSQYDRLPDALANQLELGRAAAGMLYLSIGADCDLLAVRKEQVEKVTWAGQQSASTRQDTHKLSPRHSFAAWSESVRHQARPWGAMMIEIAEELRAILSDYLQATLHKELAYQDPLTRVANRYAFEECLTKRIGECEQTGESFALQLIDLDQFKPINDTYGHGTGDTLLREVAVLMSSLSGENDVVARLGGDEFAVLQWHIDTREAADRLAERIAVILAQPMVLEGHTIRIGASVGSAVFPADGASAKTLQEVADAKLYAAKGLPERRKTPRGELVDVEGDRS